MHRAGILPRDLSEVTAQVLPDGRCRRPSPRSLGFAAGDLVGCDEMVWAAPLAGSASPAFTVVE